jgi:hypothetical protein
MEQGMGPLALTLHFLDVVVSRHFPEDLAGKIIDGQYTQELVRGIIDEVNRFTPKQRQRFLLLCEVAQEINANPDDLLRIQVYLNLGISVNVRPMLCVSDRFMAVAFGCVSRQRKNAASLTTLRRAWHEIRA